MVKMKQFKVDRPVGRKNKVIIPEDLQERLDKTRYDLMEYAPKIEGGKLYLEGSPHEIIVKGKVDDLLEDITTFDLYRTKKGWSILRVGHRVYTTRAMVRDLHYNSSDWGLDWGIGTFYTMSNFSTTLTIPDPLSNDSNYQKLLEELQKLKKQRAHKFLVNGGFESNSVRKLNRKINIIKGRIIKDAVAKVWRDFEQFLDDHQVDSLTMETINFDTFKNRKDGIELIQIYQAIYNKVQQKIHKEVRIRNIQVTYAPHTFPSSNICSACLRATEIGKRKNFECEWSDCSMYHKPTNRDINASRVLQRYGYHVRHKTEPQKATPILDQYTAGLIASGARDIASVKWKPNSKKKRAAIKKAKKDPAKSLA